MSGWICTPSLLAYSILDPARAQPNILTPNILAPNMLGLPRWVTARRCA